MTWSRTPTYFITISVISPAMLNLNPKSLTDILSGSNHKISPKQPIAGQMKNLGQFTGHPYFTLIISVFLALMRREILKGYILTLLATVAFSNVYVFSKAALNEMLLPVFLFYLFSIGFVVNLAVFIYNGKFRAISQAIRKMWWVFPTLGLIEIFTVTTFYAGVNAIKEPAVTGFLGNLYPLFTTILGVIFLKERFSPIESVGIVLVFAGALLTGYSGDLGWSDFFIPGISLVALNCLGAAVATVIVRSKVGNLPPELLSLNRTAWLVLYSAIWVLIEGRSLNISSMALTNTAIAALMEPVLSILLLYKAFQYIEASRGTIIQSLKGLIVIPVAWLYFGTLPYNYQIVGGVIATVGVMVMALGQHAVSYVRRNHFQR